MMATAAFTAPGTETPVPDAMDLRSDAGWDLGNADVEFDFDPAPTAGENDDDVSIQDAATDNGADPQTVRADQDDYMVDDGDDEEHELHYDHEQNAHSSATNQPSAAQPQPSVLPDDELLEYDDEEEEEGETPVVIDQAAGQQYQEPADAEYDHDGEYEAQSTANSAVDDESAIQNQNETYDQVPQDEFQDEYEYGSGFVNQHVDDSQYHDDVDEHTDENGGVALEGPESYAFAEEQDEESHGTMSFDIQPVTVNFLGDELWLFKEHDTDTSGDWLLEDSAVVERSLGELFTAFRKALGKDVLPEQELGLRFDSLHGLEMFEDNTACVAVSLQHLLRIYYNLHEQDGNQEPESFYMTLLPRPRFATLLADMLKHVDKGSGYSGFTAAIAANETHFTNATSGYTTDNAAWGTDEDGEVVEQAESISGSEYNGDHETPQGHDPVQNIGEHEDEEGAGDTDETKVEQGSTYAEDAQASHSGGESSGSHEQGDDDTGERASNSGEIIETHIQVPSEVAQDTQTTPPFGNDDDDYLKYDDEYETAPQVVSPPARSPSSSTLNADDAAVDGDSVSALIQTNTTNTAVGDNALSFPDNGHVEYDDASIDPGNQLGDTNQANATPSGQSSDIVATVPNAQDDQVFVADNALFDLQANGTDDAGLHFDSTDLAEHANNSFEYTEIDFDTTKDPDDTFSVYDDDGEDIQRAEGNALDDSLAIASSTADQAAPSSTDLLNNSSQGLKRTIDQIDDLGSDVTDSADIKRPRT